MEYNTHTKTTQLLECVIPLEEKQLIGELNRILTLEHGHLGMYRDFIDHEEKEIRRTFRRFAEIEAEHVEKVKSILYNLGAKPSFVVEAGYYRQPLWIYY